MAKKAVASCKAHPAYLLGGLVLVGMGLGILITYPIVVDHPLRWGIGLLAVGGLGYFYPTLVSK